MTYDRELVQSKTIVYFRVSALLDLADGVSRREGIISVLVTTLCAEREQLSVHSAERHDGQEALWKDTVVKMQLSRDLCTVSYCRACDKIRVSSVPI